MKYLGLAYFTPEKFAAMTPDDVKALVSQCPALDEKMRYRQGPSFRVA
jgi:hypothetical protein